VTRIHTRILLSLCLVATLSACATNPVTGKRELHLISTDQEVAIGEKNYAFTAQVQGGPYAGSAAVGTYVAEVGAKLAAVSDRPDLPYEFVVLNDPSPNAWALPGGKIAVNRGLLTELNNEAELAAVLAHEIVHAAARHSAKQMEQGMILQAGVAGVGALVGDRAASDLAVGGARLGAQMISRRHGRHQELESDRFGMTYMSRAGYDPSAAIGLQETFVRLSGGGNPAWITGLFSTHPPSPERVEANRRTAQTLPPGGLINSARYRARIAPLLETRSAFQLVAEGRESLARGDAGTALKKATDALTLAPGEDAAHALKGAARLELKRPGEAEVALARALDGNDGYFAHHLMRGLIRQQRGRKTDARVDLERSLELLPTGSAHLALGEMDLARGDETAASEHFSAAATGGGATAAKAAQALARLEVAKAPGRYIGVGADLDARGMVVVRIMNHAPIPVRDVEITVRLKGPDGRLGPQVRVPFAGPIPAGAGVRTATAIGPIAAELGPGVVHLLVTGAAVAE